MAEHLAKLILCGADAVAVDIPLLIALECRVCRRCAAGIPCPVTIDQIYPPRGEARIRNLMAGWHNQFWKSWGPWASGRSGDCGARWAGPCFSRTWRRNCSPPWGKGG